MLGTDLRARYAARDGVSQTVLESERRVVFSRETRPAGSGGDGSVTNPISYVDALVAGAYEAVAERRSS